MFIRLLAAMLAAGGTALIAVDKPSPGVPVKMVITVTRYPLAQVQPVTPDDLSITERYEPLPITRVTPLTGTNASLELYLLVDECSNCEFGPKLEELRSFIGAQASTTAIGVAYIRDGDVQILEKPTKDRDRVIQSLTAPSGSKNTNPFGALTDLIAKWPESSSRRAVLMIANGINPSHSDEFQNPFAEKAIETAQRAGVMVFAIYHPSADFLSSDFGKIHSGQVLLSHVAYETGGQAYFLGPEPLPSLAPMLADISDRLANQYLVEFLAQTSASADLHPISVRTRILNVELAAPNMVWVPSANPARPHR